MEFEFNWSYRKLYLKKISFNMLKGLQYGGPCKKGQR